MNDTVRSCWCCCCCRRLRQFYCYLITHTHFSSFCFFTLYVHFVMVFGGQLRIDGFLKTQPQSQAPYYVCCSIWVRETLAVKSWCAVFEYSLLLCVITITKSMAVIFLSLAVCVRSTLWAKLIFRCFLLLISFGFEEWAIKFSTNGFRFNRIPNLSIKKHIPILCKNRNQQQPPKSKIPQKSNQIKSTNNETKETNNNIE